MDSSAKTAEPPPPKCGKCNEMRDIVVESTERMLGVAKGHEIFEVDMLMHANIRKNVTTALRTAVESTYDCTSDSFTVFQNDSLIFLQGGEEIPLYDTDTTAGTFQQESNFQYLLGVKEPGCYATIRASDAFTTLFVPRLPEEYAVWMGPIRTLEEFKDEYQVESVRFIDELLATLTSTSVIYVLSGFNTDSKKPVKSPSLKAALDVIENVDDKSRLLQLSEFFNFDALYPVVSECRTIKTEKELQLMRYVTDVTNDAHIAVMMHCAPGMREFQMESLFQHYCYYVGGCRHMAYTCICASGVNGSTLHYGHAGEPNKRRLTSKDMCLFDMGAEFHRYASDVTCSYPASGSFSVDQRIIYEAVLAAQWAVMDAMKPNVSWVNLHKLAYRTILLHLRDVVHILRRDAKIDDLLDADLGAVFMPHGLGHFIGLNVHDVGGYAGTKPKALSTNSSMSKKRKRSSLYPPRPTRPGFSSLRTARILRKGMCLTVEPGIYFNDYSLDKALKNNVQAGFIVKERLDDFRGFGGVRIEDCVIVTDTGIENMTNCPRTVADVEAVMSGRLKDRTKMTSKYYRVSSSSK